MKRIPAIALLAIASLSVTTGVLAQEPVVKADIPFNFTVGSKLLPAGQYTVSSPTSGVVQIQSEDRRIVAFVTALQSFYESKGGSELVFNRYGDNYFLHQILCPSTTRLNLDIASSKFEKKARTREANLQRESPTFVAAR